MNAKLYVLIAIFGVVQGAYLADDVYGSFDDYIEKVFEDDTGGWKVGGPYGDLDPPRLGLKYCKPRFCCPIELECRRYYCVNPISRTKVIPFVAC